MRRLLALLLIVGLAAAQWSPGLVGYWRMENGLLDASGNGLTATAVGSPTFVAGQFGQAETLNGSNQYDTVPYTAALDPRAAWTISAWIYCNALNVQHSIVERYEWSGGHGGYILRVTAANKLWAITLDGTGVGSDALGKTTVTAGVWHHVAAVYDSTANILGVYLDGEADSINTSATFNALASSRSLKIGARGDDGGTPLAGKIDEVLIWNRALTQPEIQMVMMRGRP